MSRITTFLTFPNRLEDAVKLYTSIFPKSRIVKTMQGPQGELMSAIFELDGQTFYALNGGPSFSFSQGISLFISCATQGELDTYTENLIADGGEQLPCGWVRDKFGVSWQVVPSILYELMSDPDPQRAGRVMQAMMGMKKLDIASLKQAWERG